MEQIDIYFDYYKAYILRLKLLRELAFDSDRGKRAFLAVPFSEA